MNITPSIQTFILSWSSIAANWGMNRTVAQIHALLLISEEPLTADEIKIALQVARSNVSVSLRELQNWGLVAPVSVMGDRKKRFQALKDVKVMFKKIMQERKKREVQAALEFLDACSKKAKEGREDVKTRQKIDDLNHVFEKLDYFYARLIDDV